MITDKVQIGKFLSYALRHEPEKVGVKMDKNGWINIDELIQASINNGYSLDYDILNDIVENNDKKRYTISIDGVNIRANQGHSILVDVELNKCEPPLFLYHGTSERFLNSIKTQGLIPKSRLYVHLSENINTAETVGKRHGKPIVLQIN